MTCSVGINRFEGRLSRVRGSPKVAGGSKRQLTSRGKADTTRMMAPHDGCGRCALPGAWTGTASGCVSSVNAYELIRESEATEQGERIKVTCLMAREEWNRHRAGAYLSTVPWLRPLESRKWGLGDLNCGPATRELLMYSSGLCNLGGVPQL